MQDQSRNPIDEAAVEQLFALNAGAMEDLLLRPAAVPRPRVDHPRRDEGLGRVPSAEAMPPPPPPASSSDPDDVVETRSTRSTSSASRTTNRLSLTLPIAPPTAYPTRPTPTASTMGSYPPTPVDTPIIGSPADPTDFITAIATQERRVLELREELSRAEHELKTLKKQFASQERQKKRAEIRRAEPMRPLVPQPDAAAVPETDIPTRRSVELDRRKALLLGQQSGQGTPTQSRRRVFHGGHTRTLSLLSPAKTTDDFDVHEDGADDVTSPSKELDAHFNHAFSQYGPATPSQLSKRASWAPRSTQQVSGLKQVRQVVDEFRAGLSTFVEDLRQATVGAEAVTGEGRPLRGVEGASRDSQSPRAGDQETIRAPQPSARPHLSRAFEDTPTPPSRFADPLGLGISADAAGNRRKPPRSAARASKSFSWTPLVVDSYEDQDWSSWDSPTVKTDRWSGSTAIGDGSSGPEKVDNRTQL